MRVTFSSMIPTDLFVGDSPAFEQHARAIIDENMPYLQDEADKEWEYISYASASEHEGEVVYRRWWHRRLRALVEDIRHSWLEEQVGMPIPPVSPPEVFELEQRVWELEAHAAVREQRVLELKAQLVEMAEERREIKKRADDLYSRLRTAELRLQTHEIPPPCACGGISYGVYCCACGKRLQ